MKKVVSCILAVFSFMLAANATVAAAGEDKVITKDYSITFQASSDGKNVVKISAQYMFNEARKMFRCKLWYNKIRTTLQSRCRTL